MRYWFGLDKLWLSLLQRFLTWYTNVIAIPDDTAELGIDPDKPVFYVLRDRSIADLLTIDTETEKLGLPRLLAPTHLGNTQLNRSYLSIYRRKFFRRKRIASNPNRLPQLIDALTTDTTQDIQLLPVSIFWGRRPDRENSLWRIIFSDNWSPAGFFKKMFVVLTQGKHLYIQFNPVLSLRKLVDETPDRDRVMRKTARIMRVHFRRQREAVIGPDLSHRRMLVDSLVQSTPVRTAIEQQAQKDGITLKKAEAKARHYAQEMAADYSHTVARFLEIVLNWVWNRLYNGVRVYNLERLRKVANTHEIVYVPCHRSHVDYLLLSFVLYRNAMAPPHIAAGINLNLPVVGVILRRGGAFFMRRSFRNNLLYSEVFNEYIHTVLTGGYSMEYFVEGGRSRSGRLLQPRTGMLAMTAKSYLRDNRKPIAFVPIYVGYEKVIESASYINEMHGKKKKKESIFGFLGSLGFLRQEWGQVHVNFGDPIHLHEFLDTHQPDWQTSSDSTWFRPLINRLGQCITSQINAAAVVNPINLLSLALLATDKHTIDEKLLNCQLALCIKLLEKAPYSDTFELTDTDPESIINYALDNNFAFRIEHPHGDLISTEETSALQMAYVRNNILHLFALPSLISSMFLNARTLELERIHDVVQQLYPFLKSEYSLYWNNGEELDQAVNQVLEAMETQQLLTRDGTTLSGAPAHTLEADQLHHLGKIALQMQERLFLTIRILVLNGAGCLSTGELQQQAQQSAQRLSLVHEFNSPEFFDLAVFKNLVSQLVKHGLVEKDDSGKLHYDSRLLTLDKESIYILSAETRLTLQRVARQSGV